MLVLFSTPPGFYYLGDHDYYEAILNMVVASLFTVNWGFSILWNLWEFYGRNIPQQIQFMVISLWSFSPLAWHCCSHYVITNLTAHGWYFYYCYDLKIKKLIGRILFWLWFVNISLFLSLIWKVSSIMYFI
jgi:hypothetical protein